MENLQDMTKMERPNADLVKALKEMQRSEVELRAIVDSVPAHAWGPRANGYNIFCNQQWLDYIGFTQEHRRGWTWLELFQQEDVACYDQK